MTTVVTCRRTRAIRASSQSPSLHRGVTTGADVKKKVTVPATPSTRLSTSHAANAPAR